MTPGNYLFAFNNFLGETFMPSFVLYQSGDEQFQDVEVRGKSFTLAFDTATRYCTGWHDLATGQNYPCPDKVVLKDHKHWHCMHCRNKTGFNPAFYNTNNISAQQEARNQSPHALYLVNFAPGVNKVGILWAQGGIKRLVNQGARSGLIIKTYPTALIARQYEAKIAKLPDMHETLQIKSKLKMLNTPHDPAAAAESLKQVRQHLVDELDVKAEDNEPIHLDSYYFGDETLSPSVIDLTGSDSISGRCLGIIGSTLIMEQDGEQFALSLHDLYGYPVKISLGIQPNQHAPQQSKLF